ncbi:macrocin-O-methyltransferase domain protein [Candidatus Vecturithrix granuli]|uniref:Macrocin-O-methyltransferase domain protein n=1 Tax=Vecturithrix granuli TaxID=1499967 RepID=A0A081BXF3_VECG1|nr:macrocin-O-methyltransferase domain protein [Candidatus Vecturithrix granuli]
MSIQTLKSLVKRSPALTQIYYILELLPSIPPRDFMRFAKLRLIFTVKPYSGLSYARLAQIYNLAQQIEATNFSGAFVECGVWNGGSAAIMAELAKHNRERHVWLFDSWEGLPQPTHVDISRDGEPGEKGTSFGYQEKVEEILFHKLVLDPVRQHLVKGWFQDTIPSKKPQIGPIALLHLDCDWYESIKFCLNELYDQVLDGGYIIIDDYGYWQGCKQAVDEFLLQRNLQIQLNWIDDIGIYFQKTPSR